MSVQDLPPELDDLTAEPEDLTIRRLVRAIDYAEGFWLGFAKSNTPAQRRRLAALCKDLLEPLKVRVLEIELNEPVTDLLPVLRERIAQETPANAEEKTTRPKLAIFVHGFERSIPSRETYPPLLSALNLKRELFRQEVPHPLILWLPDYALTALARKAPDFWAWRSGLYEFAPEREAAEQSLEAISGDHVRVILSLSEQAKRERLVMLKGLLDDYRELGNGQREQEAQANILIEIGVVHRALGEWDESLHAHEEALAISRALEYEEGQAVALHNMARAARNRGQVDEARRLYNESLEISRRLGNRYREAILHQLGILAQEQGDIEEARHLYNESLKIREGFKDQGGVAASLHQLGRLAQEQRDIKEARRLYGQSLEISRRLNYLYGVAVTLGRLGRLAEDEGDMAEAARLFREALSLFERLGSPYAERARQSLARVESREDVSA